MSWAFLLLAILLGVAGTTSMKFSHGFKRPLPTILMFVFYVAELIPLNIAVRYIDISLAYALWSGIGTALITTIGLLWFKERLTCLKIICITLIIIGVIGLNLNG